MISRQKTRKALFALISLLIMTSIWTEMESDLLEMENKLFEETETQCKCKRKQLKSVKTKY